MDSIMHGVHGILIVAPFSQDPILLSLGALVGAAPDIIGALEKIIKKDSSVWNWYSKAHSLKIKKWYDIFKYLPPYLLHILLDIPTHGKGKRWWVWSERLYMEVLAWLITAYPLYKTILMLFS